MFLLYATEDLKMIGKTKTNTDPEQPVEQDKATSLFLPSMSISSLIIHTLHSPFDFELKSQSYELKPDKPTTHFV